MSSLSVNAALDSGTPIKLRRITVDEYHRMIRDGYFADNDRCELIDGLIIQKTSKNPPHSTVVNRAWLSIQGQLPAGHSLRIEQPITLQDSEPEPDIVVVNGSIDSFRMNHPKVDDIVFVIEVSDSSLPIDRGIKLGEYAREKIERYIILNLVEKCVHHFEMPTKDGYARQFRLKAGDVLELTVGGTIIRLDVSALFEGLPG